jgi:hypothetical protein
MEGVKMNANLCKLWLISLIGLCLAILSSCSVNATVPPMQLTKPVVIPTETSIGIPTKIIPSPVVTTPEILLTETPKWIVPSPSEIIPTATVTQIPINSVRLMINSYKETVGTLLLGSDGAIINQGHLAYGCLSTVSNSSFLYGFGSEQGGGGLKVDKIDLYGNILHHRIIPLDAKHRIGYLVSCSISPDEKWITYVQGDNNYDPRFSDHMDLWLINMEQKDSLPQHVTKNRTSMNEAVSWVSNSESFIFSDKDENGIVQLFKMTVNGKDITQITSFTESFREQRIFQAQYSPDKTRIAFTSIKDNGYGLIGIIQVDTQEVTWAQLPSDRYGSMGRLFWWNKEGNQIMTLINGNDPKGEYNQYLIVWIDVTSGQMVRFFPSKGDLSFQIENIFPLEDIYVIGIWGYKAGEDGYQSWLYNTHTSNIKKIELPAPGNSPFQLIQLNSQ